MITFLGRFLFYLVFPRSFLFRAIEKVWFVPSPPSSSSSFLTNREVIFLSYFVLCSRLGSRSRGSVFHLFLSWWNSSLLGTSAWQATPSLGLIITVTSLSRSVCELLPQFAVNSLSLLPWIQVTPLLIFLRCLISAFRGWVGQCIKMISTQHSSNNGKN